MPIRTRKSLMGCIAGFAIAMAPATSAGSAELPLELAWKQLIPPVAMASAKPKTFFNGATPRGDDGSPPPPPKPEGRWMSSPVQKRDTPTTIVTELNGKKVRIGGYIVPLDFEKTKITEFLLVPFVGACIHVPPPPANQIIYVKSENGVEIGGTFDPVTVTGKLTAAQTFTGLAETGYSIEADTVEPRTP